MKVCLSESSVEFVPENAFERDVVHQIVFHGVQSVGFMGLPRDGRLKVVLNPSRLQSVGFNDAEHLNRGGGSPQGFSPNT